MKIKINSRASQRVTRRFKWMGMAALAVLSLNYVMNTAHDAMQETLFVEAGEDKTFEYDEVYSSYIKSAQLQRDLMQ